ncbi:glycosyltransferase family 2 protein [Turicibacter sanguinis]|uniref:glycosyltransferase family 2 protein n=1 Tax=Turicibacter sanguinis TaxID=154288 RepID=UPI0018AC6388|nr:glycosyltransferase family 2 protein [Turicibacter sanguinis]MDB8566196.1 glycosyltransferase family 2 protein [Turicibacter sanguinis]MDB8568940.1 glycosyltransferase family 2 protein [Turicibacter sanguinis]MDB8571697.1 glycosyltransferase family 2 protein [Turicibacter sanguinis]MDB8580449.1 glycosyltransferase family 2 protein [Turicibacter sanguinis]
MEKPLVSILIPTYNRVSFFIKALESAVSQTYENIEIIICDNSDNKDTKMAVKDYLVKYKMITYIKNDKNLKYLGNMNKCLSLAKGEYVNFLLDDDLFSPIKIETMINYMLLDEEINLVSSPFYFINENDAILGINESILRREENYIASGRYIINEMLGNISNCIGVPTTVLFRKSALNYEFGKYKEFEFVFASDMALWLDLFIKGKVYLFKSTLKLLSYPSRSKDCCGRKRMGQMHARFF